MKRDIKEIYSLLEQKLETALGDIEHIKNCKKDNPSIKVRNRPIVLTEIEKEKVCDYIINVLAEGLEEDE